MLAAKPVNVALHPVIGTPPRRALWLYIQGKKKLLSGRAGVRYGHMIPGEEPRTGGAGRAGRARGAGGGAGGGGGGGGSGSRYTAEELVEKAEQVLDRGDPETALRFLTRQARVCCRRNFLPPTTINTTHRPRSPSIAHTRPRHYIPQLPTRLHLLSMVLTFYGEGPVLKRCSRWSSAF